MEKKKILTKGQVLSAFVKGRQDILDEVSKIPDPDRDRIFLGVWSIKELLAHLAGWDHTNMEAVREVLAGKLPAFYAHHDRDWQTYNAMLVASYKRESLDELVALVQDSQQQLIQLLETIPPEQFNKDFGIRFRGYKVTVQRLLEAEIKDEQVHSRQIMNFFKTTL